MRNRLSVSLLAIAAMVFMGLPAAAGDHVVGPDASDQSHLELERRDISLADSGIIDLREEIEIFVRLSLPSVAEFVADQVRQGRGEPSAEARRAQARRVERQHDAFRRHLERLGVEEQSSLRVGVNGLRLRAQVQDMPQLAQLPGVISVAPVTLHKPTNDTSVPWIGAPEVWELVGTGEDIIISVIDTGIDYTHASFEGSGDPADYDFIAADTTIIPEVDGTPVFPTAKVIDGFDFVGPNYDASGDLPGSTTTPEPNPNPIDVNGHGSHVAATAAGVEVEDRVGAGVAPSALLYAAKVFGDQAGSTAVTADAIEWSLDPKGDGSMDGQADVINMSLGAPWGHPDDPSALASQHATEIGTIVVASAGNSGHNAAYVTGSPAVAPGAISVAASIDGGIEVLGLEVHEPPAIAGIYEAVESAIGVPLAEAGPITQELVVAEPLLACDDIENAEEMAGKIALVQRGVCFFSIKHLKVQEAGAVGIVVYNSAPGEPIAMGGDSTGIEIPGVMISLADGQLIHDTIVDDGETVTVTMSDEVTIPRPELADTLADFTSRGPGGGSIFKPEVSAPGFSIRSAAVGTGDAARASSGTSMAAPHVAGMAALLRQQHPELDVDAIKSLIMNTTVPAEGNYPLALQGTGVVRVDRAAAADVYTTPAAVSFGRLNPLEATTVTETLAVTNMSSRTRNYRVGFQPFQQVSGVSISTSPGNLQVPAGSTRTVTVTLSLNPAQMPPDDAFFSQTEADGWLVLRGRGGAADLRSGVLAVVDPAAAVTADVAGNGDTAEVTLSNPSSTFGIAHGYTLVRTGDDAGGVTEALGVRTGVLSGFDVVQFGLATDAWESLSSRETQILINTGGPGFDYALVAADLGLLQGLPPTGTVVTALFDLSTGAGTLQWFVSGDYHNRVQGLTVDRHPPFGFLPETGPQRFDYLAVTFSRGALVGLQEGRIDLRSDADGLLNPSLGVPAGASGTLEFPADGREMLWLYPNNQVENQFQIIQLGEPPRRGGPPPGRGRP